MKNLIQNLPLSWTLNFGIDEVLTIKINRNSIWLNGGNMKNRDNFISTIEKYSKKKQVIIRGCNKSVSNKLKESGYYETLIAKEAIIELNGKMKLTAKLERRIRSLLKRGSVKEISYSKENVALFNKFIQQTIHSNEPQLKYLFIDRLTDKTRLFVFEITPNHWEGAILISKNSEFKMQGEQFFRKRNGMNGIMDTLVFEISRILRKEDYSEFSLGEVPFIVKDKSSYFSQTNLVQFIGSKFKFAYNYEGLFHFKNKFAARWDDVFICSNRKLKLFDIFGMVKKSNLLSLTVYKIFN
ncbi:MAG: DUF2156 domain-containing protein [Melioribacteraceae bacterium]|nr:DUF2156 domain-containing protein [Melioribacteraceae bacterium]